MNEWKKRQFVNTCQPCWTSVAKEKWFER